MKKYSDHIIPALKIAVIYALFGGLWILLSDHILGILVSDLNTYASLQTYKGWLYIIITAMLIFHLVNMYARKSIDVQEQLKCNEERYELALKGAQVGTWDWDIKNGDAIFNEEYTAMLGYVHGQFPPTYSSWEALIHPDDKPTVLAALAEHMEGKREEFTSEYRLLTATRHWKWILAKGRIFQWDDEGNPARAAGVHIDLTKRRANEKELEQAKESAEAANIAKGNFLANMSHEIRNPLNGLLGMLHLLNDHEMSNEAKEYLAAAQSSGKTLLTILNDILSLSLVETQDMVISKDRLDSRQLLENVERVFRPQLDQKGLKLEFSVDKGIPGQLCSDQSKLRQILFNLIGSAIKHTKSGTIHVDVTSVTDLRRMNGELLLFSIKDGEYGLANQEMQILFTPDEDKARDRERELGIGVGLHIVTRLVILLGGSLCIDSLPNDGTIITFSVSTTTTQDPQYTPPKRLHVTSARFRILVVEDEFINQITTIRFLEKLGHIPSSAQTGSEAIAMLQREKYDCILMDIQMPEMNGLETMQYIRQMPESHGNNNIPIIAMTAYALPADRQKYLSEGLNGYIAKPMSIEALGNELIRVMRDTNAQNTLL